MFDGKTLHITVFDVAASSCGALSVLEDFYREAKKNSHVFWTFVVGIPELYPADNIKVLRFPWVKKSWLHRLFFDFFLAPGIVKKNGASLVFSLQNITVPRVRIKQVVYVHQSIPFSPYRFPLFSNPRLWIYKHIIGRSIINSIRKADKIIVQTKWMKEACAAKARISAEKIEVVPPRVLPPSERYLDAPVNRKLFFCPADAYPYKNHFLIIKACSALKSLGVPYDVIFTITGKENGYARKLRSAVRTEDLNIWFSGILSKEQVFSMYAHCVLVFPSFIETYGLPLHEARLCGSIILASDLPFSHEVLEGYTNAYFFRPDDGGGLSRLMQMCISGEIKYLQPSTEYQPETNSITAALIRAARG